MRDKDTMGLILEGLSKIDEKKSSEKEDFIADFKKNFNKYTEDDFESTLRNTTWTALEDIEVENADEDSDDFKEDFTIPKGSKFKVIEYYDGDIFIDYKKGYYGIPFTKKFLSRVK